MLQSNGNLTEKFTTSLLTATPFCLTVISTRFDLCSTDFSLQAPKNPGYGGVSNVMAETTCASRMYQTAYLICAERNSFCSTFHSDVLFPRLQNNSMALFFQCWSANACKAERAEGRTRHYFCNLMKKCTTYHVSVEKIMKNWSIFCWKSYNNKLSLEKKSLILTRRMS